MKWQADLRSWVTRGALGLVGVGTAAMLMSGNVPHLLALDNQAVRVPSAAAPAVQRPVVNAGSAPTSYADAVQKASPAVVTILVEKNVQASPAELSGDDLFQRFFGQNEPGAQNNQGGQHGFGSPMPNRRNAPSRVERGLGSGVIVSPDGNILTNNHVVEGAQTVRVTTADRQEYVAKVIGTDPKTDLAVVHIDATDLPTLPLADSDAVRVGDIVLAVGNPLGIGETVTMGIISAKGRTTAVDDGHYEDFLQTDAPINQGNSGGALITTQGELIGINAQIMSTSGGNIGIGFAIPSNMARSVMAQLISTGHVRRGLLGTTVQTMNSDLAKSLGLTSARGALVADITAGGPAARAGLQQKDVILKIDGHPIETSNDLRNRVSALAPGTAVTLEVQRNGTVRTLTATLGDVPEDANATTEKPADSNDLGATVEPLTPQAARQYHVASGTMGLVITGVDSSSVAARIGLQPGDVVRQVNGQAIRSADDLTGALNARRDRPSSMLVQRGERAFYVAVPARR
jgi:serine protease Do